MMKPPMKKLTRFKRPCSRNFKLIDMNRPTRILPMRPPKNSSTPMKMAMLASIHFFEKEVCSVFIISKFHENGWGDFIMKNNALCLEKQGGILLVAQGKGINGFGM